MLDDFTRKIREKYWTKGALWEFDWYIDCFFAEAMSFGSNPIKIGYMQPVLGDMFLSFKYGDLIKKEFSDFLFDRKNSIKLIENQVKILNRTKKCISNMESGVFSPIEYKQTQLDLSLLMGSVSVVFDEIMPDIISSIAKHKKNTEQELIDYVIEMSNQNKLNESNQKLLEVYSENPSMFENSKFNFKKLPIQLRKKMSEHALLYGWLNTGERGGKDWNEEDFMSQLKVLIKRDWHKSGDLKINLHDQKTKEVINSLVKINTNDNQAADLQVRLDWLFQNYLKNKLGEYYVEKIIENLTYEEILEVIKRPKMVNSFAERKNSQLRAVWPQDGSLHFHYFKNKNEFNKVLALVEETPSTNVIKGNIACRGIGEGKVRLIEKQADMAYFVEGEVLVATKTQPSYVVVMNKAAAIVTDMGGITSHAAIISREFGIPCIVGTRNATKLLKNGDLVYVDANKGTVTKRD